jgi:steroid delta-isomerase-like uncharacterized protein
MGDWITYSRDSRRLIANIQRNCFGRKSARKVRVSARENKALVRRFFEEAWRKGNVAAVDEFMATDYLEHPLPSGLPPGREGLRRLIAAYRSAFPDLKITLDDIFAEGEMVAFRWSARGTHMGDWLGILPAGNHVAATGITIFRIAGGKVVESWTSIDLNPSEEEVRWLTEVGGWTRNSGISLTEADPSSPMIWEVLTRNLTWRFRIAEARERERIEPVLQVARRIQQALLPKTVPALDGWEVAAYYKPAREVGGDFYDFFELEDDRVGFVVGDATGKGMPAALVMATTRGMLRAVAQPLDSPGEVLQRVNDALYPDIPPNAFVTCPYAILDPESGCLRYANAGHDLPYRRHGGGAEELRARGMPLGLSQRWATRRRRSYWGRARASSSTAMAWSRLTTLKERCSASRGFGRSPPSTIALTARSSIAAY